MSGELYHGEGDVHEVFAVVAALIYREAFFKSNLRYRTLRGRFETGDCRSEVSHD